ncbi:MAG: IS66 family transposase zinc-finger binding domain-containing protein [Sandaracinaceae bacterium]|nr:IS66 family transposase zinc-finger binding domain-containing protein [Sandaracinaceae bacterium]
MRREYSPSLLRVDNVLAVPCDQHTCPSCQQPLVQLEPEVTEVLDYKPGALFVRRDIREVFGCRANDCAVVRGPLGDKVIPGPGAVGHRVADSDLARPPRRSHALRRDAARWHWHAGAPQGEGQAAGGRQRHSLGRHR